MYMATQDPVLEQRHKEIEQRCQRLIDRHDQLGFIGRWLDGDRVIQAIHREWREFELWQDRHMSHMRLMDKIDKWNKKGNT